MPINYDKVAEVISAAAQAAVAADPGRDNDHGTCNFDTPVIYIPRVSQKRLDSITKATGVGFSSYNSRGKRAYTVGVPLRGQADRRTKMMQAALNVLKDRQSEMGDGVMAFGHYAMD